ncbi:hypothetical protein EVAR_56925_1 [Eumeta japonica]|uniref:Uncharacterized protein n=1 Tax=Eumeta variegata TaxID=151549 RepID=A0A4C1YG72_EUMVA|nr:hypothetical protein EVAR_56925_1 [Eumeta japonica]
MYTVDRVKSLVLRSTPSFKRLFLRFVCRITKQTLTVVARAECEIIYREVHTEIIFVRTRLRYKSRLSCGVGQSPPALNLDFHLTELLSALSFVRFNVHP